MFTKPDDRAMESPPSTARTHLVRCLLTFDESIGRRSEAAGYA